MAKGTDIWVLGTALGGHDGRRRGGIIGVYEHRANGEYGSDMRPPIFLRVIVTDKDKEELERLGVFHLNDSERRARVRHPYVLNIDRMPAMLREPLVATGHVEARWNDVAKYFEKRVRIEERG